MYNLKHISNYTIELEIVKFNINFWIIIQNISDLYIIRTFFTFIKIEEKGMEVLKELLLSLKPKVNRGLAIDVFGFAL